MNMLLLILFSAVASSTIFILCTQTLYVSFLCIDSTHVDGIPLTLPIQSDWFSEQLVLERQQVALLFFSGFRIIDSHCQPGSCFSFY